MTKRKTPAAHIKRLREGDAPRVRRCLAAAIRQIDRALECERPAPTTAEGFVKLRALRLELGERLKAFDERLGLKA